MSMFSCKTDERLNSLELPREFEDLSGLLKGDIKAIVNALTDRADQKLLLTRRERQDLRRNLWNRLTEVVNQTLEPLSAEYR